MSSQGQVYLKRQDLEQMEEAVKRKWKMLVVMLALSLRAVPEATRQVTDGREQGGETHLLTILLVHGSQSFASEITPLLERDGFRVISCTSSEQAMEKIKEAHICLLDERLPNNEEMCRQIREQTNVPIILLGFNPDGKAWEKAAVIGADAYLKKSLSRRELVARIKAILRRYDYFTLSADQGEKETFMGERVNLDMEQELINRIDAYRGEMERADFIRICLGLILSDNPELKGKIVTAGEPDKTATAPATAPTTAPATPPGTDYITRADFEQFKWRIEKLQLEYTNLLSLYCRQTPPPADASGQFYAEIQRLLKL